MSNYIKPRAEDHERFLCDELLPLLDSYAKASKTPTWEVEVVSFLTLAAVLNDKGLSARTLVQCIDDSIVRTSHKAPEGLQ